MLHRFWGAPGSLGKKNHPLWGPIAVTLMDFQVSLTPAPFPDILGLPSTLITLVPSSSLLSASIILLLSHIITDLLRPQRENMKCAARETRVRILSTSIY